MRIIKVDMKVYVHQDMKENFAVNAQVINLDHIDVLVVELSGLMF